MFIKYSYLTCKVVLGGVMVIVLTIASTFACSNPAEGDGFLRAIKSLARFPSEGK
jgi:hypothetical protein